MTRTLPVLLLVCLVLSCSMRSSTQSSLEKITGEIGKIAAVDASDTLSTIACAALPIPLQRFFQYAGFTGKTRTMSCSIEYDTALCKLGPKGDWRKAKSTHLIFAGKPSRIVYTRLSLFKVIPFENYDQYLEGKSMVQGTLGNHLMIYNTEGERMDSSALVAYLSEILFLPPSCLDANVRWTPIDSATVAANITYEKGQASGTFHFNTLGQLVSFTSSNRYDGSVRCKWRVNYGDYRYFGNFLLPSTLTAVWEYEGSEQIYFKARIKGFSYNTKDIGQL